MTLDPEALAADPDRLERIEKATLRMVTQAMYDFDRDEDAGAIFAAQPDLAQDVAEDITREALDRLGTSAIPIRLFGKVDYKRARYVFHEDYAMRQALFVDSKAEQNATTASIQTDQTSMRIRQVRAGVTLDEAGGLPVYVEASGHALLTTTIFVKYVYRSGEAGSELTHVTVLCLPSGLLQDRYNPDARRGFWRAGRNAPTLGEPFRVRVNMDALREAAPWRVQTIPIAPPREPFAWAG